MPSRGFLAACQEPQRLFCQEEKTGIKVNAIIQQHLMVPEVPLSLPLRQIYVSVMKCLLTGLYGPQSALLNQAC